MHVRCCGGSGGMGYAVGGGSVGIKNAVGGGSVNGGGG